MQLDVSSRAGCVYDYDAGHDIHMLRFQESSVRALDDYFGVLFDTIQAFADLPDSDQRTLRILIDNRGRRMPPIQRGIQYINQLAATFRRSNIAEVRVAGMWGQTSGIAEMMKRFFDRMRVGHVSLQMFTDEQYEQALAWLTQRVDSAAS